MTRSGHGLVVFVVFKVEPWKGARHWAGVAAVEQLARAGVSVHLFARPDWLENPVFPFLETLDVKVWLPSRILIGVSSALRVVPKAVRMVMRSMRRRESIAASRQALVIDDGRDIEHLWLRRSLSRASRHARPDVVHAFGATQWTGVAIGWAALRGIPVVYTETQQVGEAHYTRVLQTFVQRCSVITVHGRCVVDGFRSLGYRRECAVVPFGIPSPGRVAEPRAAKSPIVIGCASRYEREKGLSFLIEAFAAFRQRVPGVRLVLAGEGSAREELVRLVLERGLDDAVEIRQPYDLETGLASFMDSIDVYCLPSLCEGQPVSIIEAMAYGKPVIASDVGSVAEMLDEGAGLVVKPGDADELAAAFMTLAADEGARDRMGRCARQRFLARHQAGRLAGAYVDLYESVAGHHERQLIHAES